MARILVLEDDRILAQTIISILESEGHHISLASTGPQVLEYTFDSKYDLYLFDVNVPIIDGFNLLKELRSSGDSTTTFFITALNDFQSFSYGFEIGANDYIKKPFDLDEFLVRVRAVLKRHQNLISYKNIIYDPSLEQFTQDGNLCFLAPVESSILLLFMQNIGKTIEKTAFYELMESASDTALRVHISSLKQKLNLNMTNIRSVGYRLEPL